MSSIFTRIINGEIPSYRIAENKDFYAFLDINPIAWGHTLVIPKKEVDYYFDLDDNTLASINLFAKSVAASLKANVNCLRVGVTVIGLEVPHAHIHLVPLNQMNDIDFLKQKPIFSREQMQELADRVYAHWKSANGF